MRRALFVILALAILIVGVGVLVYSAGWLTPAMAASTTSVSGSASPDSAVSSADAPSADEMGAAEPGPSSDVEGEMATYTQQSHDGLCDHDKSASAAY